MGEVYRARDTKLNRDVALKVLPEVLAHDAERMARFQREAQVLAALNHPNIAAIYGLEESGATHALVMELVEGHTLAERIVGAGLVPAQGRPQGSPLRDDALPIAKQIADALEYAHERGIIHRDLKPANIKITPEGTVKVLDFGLAKALDPTTTSGVAPGFSPASPDAALKGGATNSPTLSIAATQAGVILGTAAYMSPEQARGKQVDRRADIWAFGCVLYEMLSGAKPFEGETVTDVLAAVVRAEPDLGSLPSDTPPRLLELIRRCLTKDLKQRLRDIGEARIAIEETLSGPPSPLAPQPQGEGGPQGQVRGSLLRRALPWTLAGLVAGASIAGLLLWRFAAPAPPSSLHFSTVTNFAGVQAQPALSPDGRSVVFISNRDGHYNIYVGLISGGSLVQITHDINLKDRPSWSPDGTEIAYAQLNDSGIWDIWEVQALGGTPRRLILNATDPAWSPDGQSLAYENTATGTIWIADSSGQNARALTQSASPLLDTDPCFSPDGRRLAFVIRPGGPHGELAVLDLNSGKIRQLTHDDVLALSPAWSPDGHSIYFASSRGGTMNIWKIGAGGGRPEQITAGRGDDAQLDVSKDGKIIVFSTFQENVNLVQMDLQAKRGVPTLRLLTSDPARNQLAPAYSPDGKRLAYFSNHEGTEKESIWVANADGSNPIQLVKDNQVNIFPRWTPDSQRLIYHSDPASSQLNEYDYRSVPVSGGAPEDILKNAMDLYPDVGPDGRLLFKGPKSQIQTLDPRSSKTQTLATLPAEDQWWLLRWSPDGHSIAYIVNPGREGDPNAGLWVDDFKSSPRQIFRGWVVWYARGPANQIYLLEGKPDSNGVLWKVGWDGHGLARTPITIPLNFSYWTPAPYTGFDVSPDGRHLAAQMEEVLEAHIGLIENVR
jgi:Tol biopolymer transport system component